MGSKIDWFKEKMGRGPKAKAAKQAAAKPEVRWFDARASMIDLLDKLDRGIALYEEVVPASTGGAPSASQQARTAYNGWRQQQAAITGDAKQNIVRATTDAETLIGTLEAEYTRIRKEAKKKPYTHTVDVGNGPQNVNVFGSDIPGFYEAGSDAERKKLVEQVAPKIGRGMNKLRDLRTGNAGGAAQASDVTDLLWALKTIGQQKEEAAFEKGSMSVEDTGERLRSYLDTCSSELYLRSSSHFLEQQQQRGQQSRGMDFYGGTGGTGGIADADLLLPTGMNTLTYQTMTLPTGGKTLYLKMETEGAFKTAPAHMNGAENLQRRPQRAGDLGNTGRHALNFIGKKHESDKDLATFREEVPDDIKGLMKDLIKSLDTPGGKPLRNALKASMGTKPNKVGMARPTFRINTFMNAIGSMPENTNLSEQQADRVNAFIRTVTTRYPDAGLRGGGEVVITASELP